MSKYTKIVAAELERRARVDRLMPGQPSARQSDLVIPTVSLNLEQRRHAAALMKGRIDRRRLPMAGELRMAEVSSGDALRISILAYRSEFPYEVSFFEETIARGAAKRTLGENPDVSLLLQHGEAGSGYPIARTTATPVSMWLEETDEGLVCTGDLDPEDPDVQLLGRKMARGLIGGPGSASFAFTATDQEWSEDRTVRRIKSLSLHRGDVSICVHGANPGTTSSMRGLGRVSSDVIDFGAVRRQREDQSRRARALRKG